MGASEKQWILAEGRRPALLACRACGRGQCFIWGHTLLGSMAQEDAMGVFGWHDCANVARVIRYDARGHGRSESSPDAEDYTWPSLARDMWQVADYQAGKERRVILGGASMGCATAIQAACQQPARVKGLVLVLPPTAYADRRRAARAYELGASAVALTRGLPLKALHWFPRTIRGDLRQRMERATSNLLATANPRGMVAALRGAARSDLPPPGVLAGLTIPTLILAWSGDSVHPVASATALARTLPNTELHICSPQEAVQWPQFVRRFLLALSRPEDEAWWNVPLD